MSEYPKECVFCKDKIRMSDQSGKWLPYNPNGYLHECKSKTAKKQEPPTQVKNEVVQSKQKVSVNNDVSLEIVLKKLESIGITLDLEKLRYAK